MTIREWLECQRASMASGPRTLAELATVAGVGDRSVWQASQGEPVSSRIAKRIEDATGGVVRLGRLKPTRKEKRK